MAGFLSRLFRRSDHVPAVWIDADELRRRREHGAVLLIDVRQPEEFNAPPGHLPGAVNVPLGDLEHRIAEVVTSCDPVVLVCKTDRRSARAADILLAVGVRNVTVLRGGTDGWHGLGLPLE